MSRVWAALLAVVLAFGVLGFGWLAGSAASHLIERQVQPAGSEEPAPARERSADPNAPAISFIDSPSATCTNPVRGTDICYIDWSYLYVTASTDQYIISMTVSIDGDLRAYHSGFFQNTMYIPTDLTGKGYRVACGAPGSGSLPDQGFTYGYTLRARETGGLRAANYGSVTCPADVKMPTIYLALVGRGD